MIEYAVFGFATLVWWTWPLVFVTVMLAVGVVVLGDRFLDRRRDRKAQGRYPCLVLVASDRGEGLYCGRITGHGGECGGMVIASCPVLPGTRPGWEPQNTAE